MKLDASNPYSLSEIGDNNIEGASNYLKAVFDE